MLRVILLVRHKHTPSYGISLSQLSSNIRHFGQTDVAHDHESYFKVTEGYTPVLTADKESISL
jgi:hypothetical protein